MFTLWLSPWLKIRTPQRWRVIWGTNHPRISQKVINISRLWRKNRLMPVYCNIPERGLWKHEDVFAEEELIDSIDRGIRWPPRAWLDRRTDRHVNSVYKHLRVTYFCVRACAAWAGLCVCVPQVHWTQLHFHVLLP